jgi:hypothetical protein
MCDKIGRHLEAMKEARRNSTSAAIRGLQADRDARRYRQGRVTMTPELLAHFRAFGIEPPKPWECTCRPRSDDGGE